MKSFISIKYAFLFIALALMLAMPLAHADTNLTNCHDTLNTGVNYLQNDVLYDSFDWGDYGYCLAVGYGMTLDCLGHTIDMNYSISNGVYVPFITTNAVIKNCKFTNTNTVEGIFLEYMGDNSVENSTFFNISSGIVAEFGDNTKFINNTFENVAGIALNLNGNAGQNVVITGNTFHNTGSPIQILGLGNNYIYNNKFLDGTGGVAIGGGLTNYWNSTKNFYKESVLGSKPFGGNFWGECTDNDCDGYCDDNITFDGSNIDQAPLSGCVKPIIIPAIKDMDKLGESYSCTGDTLKKITTYGYCTNETGCGTTTINSTSVCESGCNAKENTCNPPAIYSNALFLLVIAFLAVLGYAIYTKH